MAEEKMISIEKMDEVMKDYFPAEETVDFHGLELTVQKTIGAAEMFEIVRKVSDSCFTEDGVYMPEVYDPALRVALITAYSNVRLPENAEHMAQILYRTDLYTTVVGAISSDQYCAICDAIYERIGARNNMNKALFETEIQRAVAGIQNLGDQLSQLFGEVSPEDIKAMVGAIGEGGIDEEKLVSAVVGKQNELREKAALEVIEGGKDGE